MATELTHADIQELLGAYALDAVPEDERELVEQHLRDCARCRQEVAEHREAAALLALGAPAPGGLWDQIAETIGGRPPEKELVPVLRPRRSRAGWGAAAAAAALAVAVVGFMGVRLVQQGDRIDNLEEVSRSDGIEAAAERAGRDPRSQQVSLAGEEGSTVATVVVLPNGRGFLVDPRLPALPEARTYQLWALVGETTVSAGVLGNEPGVAAFSVDLPVDGFAISEEPEGGVPVPSAAPIAVGTIETN
jgi:hypothetical protein